MQPPEPSGGSNSGLSRRLTRQPPARHGAAEFARHVVLIGASIRSAAESARDAGYCVTGIDCFGDVDSRSLCDEFVALDELARMDDSQFWEWVRARLPARFMQVGGVPAKHTDLLRRIARSNAWQGASERQRQQLANPRWLKEVADEAGVGFPETLIECDGPADVSGHLGVDERWLVKDGGRCLASSGGFGVRWATSSMRGGQTVNGHDVNGRNVNGRTVSLGQRYLQRWIPGRPMGASFYSDGHSVSLLGVCRSSIHRIGDRPFIYAGSFGPIPLPHQTRTRLQRLGTAVTRRSGLRGLFGIDLMVNQRDELNLIEINPRWTASSELIERSQQCCEEMLPGKTLIGAVLEQCRADEMDEAMNSASRRCGAGKLYWKRILFSRRSGRMDYSRLPVPINEGLAVWRRGDVEYRVADLPHGEQKIRRNEPILSLIVSLPQRDSKKYRLDMSKVRHLVRAISNSIRP